MKNILKYPGGKWAIAPWIIGQFPKHHSYLEPFFGSGGVFFKKEPSNIETINDLDGEVVNFFECVRTDPEKLAHYIYFTPYSVDVYNRAYSDEIPADRFERASRFLVRCNMGYGYRTSGRAVGWKRDVAKRERAYAAKAWCELPDIVFEAAERLRGVQIENKNAVELIPQFSDPNVLIYCDPPYVLSTRRGKQYRCEMSDEDHLQLLDVLKQHPGPVLLSGYQNDLYDAELKNWNKVTTTCTDILSQIKTETLWMNFEPVEQISLWA